MSLSQVITIVSTSLITIVIVIVGIQIIFLLKEFRQSFTRINHLIDLVESALHGLSQPAAAITGLLESLKQSNSLFKLISNFLDRNSPPSPPIKSENYEPLE